MINSDSFVDLMVAGLLPFSWLRLFSIANGLNQGLLYTRTEFVPKEITKTRPKTRFDTISSEVAKIQCVRW